MAGVTFNADEVFAIALEIERNGARYYRKAAGFARDANAKALLEMLASMEDKHHEIFSQMKKTLAGADRSETVWDPEGEAQAYLSAMADRRVFDLSDLSLALSGKESMEAVFKKAILLEKDSVVFYVGMKARSGEVGRGQDRRNHP